jgi:hypothetical protein
MQDASKSIIVVPVYKASLTENEISSLRQCFEVLHQVPFCFICSNSFFFKENYQQFIPGNIQYTVSRFDDKYFTSLEAYNKLLLSIKFYKRFRSYQYLLIYQLDAWVFKNELDYWCAKGYAYIGAPWFQGWHNATPESKFIGIGNGGFSLRDITKHIKVLNAYRYKIMPRYHLSAFFKHPSISGFKHMVKNLLFRHSPFDKYYRLNEDVFWGRIAPKLFKDFMISDMKTALRFSIEVNPSKYVNANDLPFGCHAWEKFEPEFWKQFISV